MNETEKTKYELLRQYVDICREIINKYDIDVSLNPEQMSDSEALWYRYTITKAIYKSMFAPWNNVYGYVILPDNYLEFASRREKKFIIEDRRSKLVLPIAIYYLADVKKDKVSTSNLSGLSNEYSDFATRHILYSHKKVIDDIQKGEYIAKVKDKEELNGVEQSLEVSG